MWCPNTLINQVKNTLSVMDLVCVSNTAGMADAGYVNQLYDRIPYLLKC
jgi:hypothetical protein